MRMKVLSLVLVLVCGMFRKYKPIYFIFLHLALSIAYLIIMYKTLLRNVYNIWNGIVG